ncbi:uncharacterized protein LOC108736333 [Agrilus planipennis]|uniref:Uncharacterized protein LOC108736333 n=1 Tax=Agrilus planipennis TaxID=224129 RepID=A0A1W4WVQ2_AGRPL|nr:uncharacterized protein LOC108736333 [Agrilus planipennis]
MISRIGCVVAFVAATLACASSRAVNISNTWMLPEEGFPVFYRYFRDRISWYEADAVCQFHHANLVTVDNTSQFDAVRAFLKELDITNNVWIGLSRNSDKAQFAWSDFQPLTNEGYWQEAVPETTGSLCAATDPAADFRWHGLSCGGPDVASFICELPVPKWALGTGGCLITELPSLTVLYVPEQSAVELISDCGLDGTKQIACKGNTDREEMMKQLSCGEFDGNLDDKSTKPSVQMNSSPDLPISPVNTPVSTETKTTKHWTSNTVDVDAYYPTRHRRETDNTLSSYVTRSTLKITDDSNMKVENTTTSHVLLRGDTVDEVQHNLSTTNKEEKDSSFTTDPTTFVFKASPVTQEDTNEYPGVINQGQLFSLLDNVTFDVVDLNETGTVENGPVKEYLLTTEQQGQKLTTNVNKETTTPRTTPNEITITTVLYQKEPPQDEMPVTNKDLKKPKKEMETQTFPTNRTYDDIDSNNTTDADISDSKTSLDKKVEFAIYQASETSRSLHEQKPQDDLITKEKNIKKTSKEIELFPIATDPNVKLNRTFRKQLPTPTKFPKKYVQASTYIPNTKYSGTKDSNDKTRPVTEEISEHIILDGNKEHKVVEIKLHSSEKENITKLVITTKRLKQNESPDSADVKKVPKTKSPIKNDNETKFLLTSDSLKPEGGDIISDGNSKQEKIPSITEAFPYFKKTNKLNNQQEMYEELANLNSNSTDTTEGRNFSKADFEIQQAPLKLDSVEPGNGEELQRSVNENKLENSEPTLQSLQSEPEVKKNLIRNRKVTKSQRTSYYPFFIGRVIG